VSEKYKSITGEPLCDNESVSRIPGRGKIFRAESCAGKVQTARRKKRSLSSHKKFFYTYDNQHTNIEYNQ
jgi:hypothetical protein